MKRRTLIVTSEKPPLRCARCGRRARLGERLTITVTPGLATYKHAGRTCPRLYNPRPL